MDARSARFAGLSAAVVAVVLAACSSSPTATPSNTSGNTSPASVPTVSATSFTSDFSVMSQLKGLASQGKGKIGVLLPETSVFLAIYFVGPFHGAVSD